jgi:hypothetical protein
MCRTRRYPLLVTVSRITVRSMSMYLSMALQPSVRPWPLFHFLNLFTESVGLLEWGSALHKSTTRTEDDTNTE